LNLFGLGGTAQDGALRVTGNSTVKFASNPGGGGTLNMGGVTTNDATSMFPNAGLVTITGSAIGVDSGVNLDVSAVPAGSDLIKLGAGTMTFSGALNSTTAGATTPSWGGGIKVKAGSVVLNKPDGLPVTSNTAGQGFVVGDDTTAA